MLTIFFDLHKPVKIAGKECAEYLHTILIGLLYLFKANCRYLLVWSYKDSFFSLKKVLFLSHFPVLQKLTHMLLSLQVSFLSGGVNMNIIANAQQESTQ